MRLILRFLHFHYLLKGEKRGERHTGGSERAGRESEGKNDQGV